MSSDTQAKNFAAHCAESWVTNPDFNALAAAQRAGAKLLGKTNLHVFQHYQTTPGDEYGILVQFPDESTLVIDRVGNRWGREDME